MYDLKLTAESLESCWIKILKEKQKNIIIGFLTDTLSTRDPSMVFDHYLGWGASTAKFTVIFLCMGFWGPLNHCSSAKRRRISNFCHYLKKFY